MATLAQEKAKLEAALKSTTQHNVRNALEIALREINIKLTKKAGRKTTLRDGILIGTGSTVYELERGYDADGEFVRSIQVKTVCQVSSSGQELCTGSHYRDKHAAESKVSFYGSREAAQTALLAHLEETVTKREHQLTDASDSLKKAKAKLEAAIAEQALRADAIAAKGGE